MSEKAKNTIIKVVYWFPIREATCIRDFSTYKPPHALLMIATNKVILQEDCYQLTSRLSKTIEKGKKGPCHVFPLTIGVHSLENFKEAEAKVEEIKGFYFVDLSLRKYDPKGVVAVHFKAVGFGWSYRHFKGYEEDIIKKLYNPSREFGMNEKQEE